MKMAFLKSIESAIIFFPIVALLFTIPYMIYQYHKYGSIPIYRSIIIYSLLLYILCSFFLVILPLPSQDFVMQMKSPHYNLIPFHFVTEIKSTTTFQFSDFATYFPSLKFPVVYEALFNIILLIPLGVYFRYYFNYNFKKSTFLSFCTSLFFELTQLTGLYFIYPRSYRVFDVDDLILNTFGGIIGYWIGFLMSKKLPSKEIIDKEAYDKGTTVSIIRRIISTLTDFIIILIIIILSSLFFINQLKLPVLVVSIFIVFLIIVYYTILPLCLNQGTIAMNFYHLKYTSSQKVTFIKLFSFHYFHLFCYYFLPISMTTILLIIYKNRIVSYHALKYLLIISFTIIVLYYAITILKIALKYKTIPEKLSKVTIKSTLIKKL